MKFTFVGHQSWLVEHGGSALLVDPVLDKGFGHSPELVFTIWPPRAVDTAAMPKVDAVFLTHEHLDHFHIPSLDMLPRDVVVHTGVLTPMPVVEAIERLGFTVVRVHPAEQVEIGEIVVTAYAAGPETISWEKRVFQLVFAERGGAGGNDVFIPVDALASREYLADVNAGRRLPPRIVVLANNSQVVPKGALGPYTNLLPVGNQKRSEATGMQILNALIDSSQTTGLPPAPEVFICGGGYVGPRAEHGPFLYGDHHQLAQWANDLQDDAVFYGPWPGESLTVTHGEPVSWGTEDWITLDDAQRRRGEQQLAAYLADPKPAQIAPVLAPFETEAEVSAGLADVEAALPELARCLFHTRAGQVTSSVHTYLGRSLGSQRALLMLLDGPGGTAVMYAWDIAVGGFVPVPGLTTRDALRSYAFGIQVFFRDFVALLRGEQQIWDLAGTAMQSWYIGDSYSTLITAFYEIFGEQARPDLAAKVYQRAHDLHFRSRDVRV